MRRRLRQAKKAIYLWALFRIPYLLSERRTSLMIIELTRQQ